MLDLIFYFSPPYFHIFYFLLFLSRHIDEPLFLWLGRGNWLACIFLNLAKVSDDHFPLSG